MFWADRIAREIEDTVVPRTGGKPLIIRDEKTLSGRVHVGSMRGLAIHGLVSEILSERKVPHAFLWEHNDFDPFDAVPPGYLDVERFTEHLGKPLYTVPSPEPGFENYAEYFAADFEAAHRKIGMTPTYYRTFRDLYGAGKMDPYIRNALERAADIRRILKAVSGSVKDESWLPVSVVCENCGKMMTTRAYDFDGETVAYTCDKSPDDTVPCGHTGRIAPWKGGVKLFWKADWAAKWSAMDVHVEGAGKDHSTKGGSRDVANHIAREVFDREPPYDIPYEFFLIGGQKMSTSKGRGSFAKEMADLFPATVFRLLMLGKDINQQINIEPTGDSVPRLYDLYDDLAQMIREGVADDFTRLYELCQMPAERAEEGAPWQLRFGQVAFIVQMPHLDLEVEATRVKGNTLTEDEKKLLAERAEYARFWLLTYAPEQFVYKLQDRMPEGYKATDTQKKALTALRAYIEEMPRSGEELHARLHELKSEVPIEPKELFSALYTIFLGRTSGPKAGWFLSVLPRDFVLERLADANA